MASTNKTPKLGLNQWEPGDSVLREDFNGDNAKLEAGIESLVTQGSCVTGVFTGNGVANRTIPLDFTPKAVLLLGQYNENYYGTGWLMGAYSICKYGGYIDEFLPGTLDIVDKGFFIALAIHFNQNKRRIQYIAFR